jgi:hypothetical protein
MNIRIGTFILVFTIITFGLNQQDFIGFSTAQAQSKEDYEDNTKSDDCKN